MHANAPAKVNLFLKVVARRPDGYHDLENVFLPLPDLHDTLSLEPLPDDGSLTRLVADGPYDVPTDASNLCLKAVEAFARATGLTPRIRLQLTKRIPVAAGLGGGSSDAAATLLLLNRHCRTGLTDSQLEAIAATLGADVPFFIRPHLALGTGRGDRLAPIDAAPAPLTLLLLTPAFPVPVAWSFAHRLPPPADAPELPALLDALRHPTSPETLAALCRNDLEHALFHKFPLLDLMRQRLLDAGALTVHVSGSGPSLFAIVPDDDAERIRQTLTDAFPSFPQPTLHRVRFQ